MDVADEEEDACNIGTANANSGMSRHPWMGMNNLMSEKHRLTGSLCVAHALTITSIRGCTVHLVAAVLVLVVATGMCLTIHVPRHEPSTSSISIDWSLLL